MTLAWRTDKDVAKAHNVVPGRQYDADRHHGVGQPRSTALSKPRCVFVRNSVGLDPGDHHGGEEEEKLKKAERWTAVNRINQPPMTVWGGDIGDRKHQSDRHRQ